MAVQSEQAENDALASSEHIANSTNESEVDDTLDVLIIGAGWAGLSAGTFRGYGCSSRWTISDAKHLPPSLASTLKKKGIVNFRILEAKDHIGGRAFTHHEKWEGKDLPLDLGAMWIQNAASNLLHDYANKYKQVISHPSTFETKVYRENNKGPLSDDEYEEFSEALFDEGFYVTQKKRQAKAWKRGDEPLQKSADKFLETLADDPFKQSLAKVFLRDNIETEYSGSLKELSLRHWNSDSWIGGERSADFFVLTGYTSLVHAYAEDEGIMENILLNAPVTSIDYESSGAVQVSYAAGVTNGGGEDFSVRAKKVIITVPLGVLQAKSISFKPELPISTSNAINRLGMGKMNKIFMMWKSEDVFWPFPSSTEVLEDLTDRDSNFFFYTSLSLKENIPVLFAFFQGSVVEQLEDEYAQSNPALYEQKIADLAMESLCSMFGESTPRPEKVVVTHWSVDEYTMGAYSFNKVGMKQHDREVLASSIGGKRIYFAGEATHNKYFATTTGAFMTGRNAAKSAVKSMKKK
eukprot:scaffold3151_cov110-Cylindrotheca_fusiformis.AAC.12